MTPGSQLRFTEVARGPPGARQVIGQYAYNADDLRIRVRQSSRNADAWYDGLALLMEQVEQGGHSAPWVNTVRYHHDTHGLHAITAHHEGLGSGRSTHFAHCDGIGSTIAVSRPAPSGPDGLVVAYEVDEVGRVLAETLAPGTADAARTTFGYDGLGRLTEVVRPLHQGATPPVARRMQWDGFGRLTEAVDKAGHQTPIEPLWPPR